MASSDHVTELAIRMDDGSDHDRTRAELKSKLFEPATPSSASRKLTCPRVPQKLIADTKQLPAPEDFYSPQLISFGPYHHGKHGLQKGETIKLKFAAVYINEVVDLNGKDDKAKVDEIYHKIQLHVDEWKTCYDGEATKSYKDDEFTKMMLVDGCALLSYVLCVYFGHDFKIFDIRYHDLSLVHRDALLLENQLPYKLLQLLMKTGCPIESVAWTALFQEFFGMTEESSFLQRMKDYCCKLFLPVIPSLTGNPEPKPEQDTDHLLHLYRRNLLGNEPSERKYTRKGNEKDEITGKDVREHVMASFRNATELTAAGIRILPSRTRHLRDISFTSGGITAALKLPPITIDKSTKTLFLNLIAYEMSSVVPHEFISYLGFLDSLIDHADDVKELQSAGVLQNSLGTHEAVADFFNTVSANLESDFPAYKDVRVKIWTHLKSHYNSKMKIWMTQCLNDYFSSPWTIIAWLGAAFALFLTAVQTYYSVFPH